MTVLPNDRILFTMESWLQPRATLLFDARAGTSVRLPAFSDLSPPLQNVKWRREFAVSKDGTRIPLTIISPGDLPDRQPAPCIATGYGGYRDSMRPTFEVINQALLEAGCRLVVVHTRGGFEYGEDWYRGGMLMNRQNVVDDFAAGLQHVISRGYTMPEQLGLVGFSNGGALVGSMLAQHPKLFGACIAYFGFYDFLRSELHSNGQYSIPALGTVTNPEQYPVLRDSSPYHHIAKGTDYPATLLITSVNDPRVDPMHSRKMAAAMQTRTQSSKPILLLTVGNTGDFVVREEDTYGFLLNEIGALWKPPVQSLRLPGADGRSRRTRR